MTCARPAVPESPGSNRRRTMVPARGYGFGQRWAAYDEMVARLHDLLLRVARAEVHRRRAQLPMTGAELDEIRSPDERKPE